jgi:hypothetical protein
LQHGALCGPRSSGPAGFAHDPGQQAGKAAIGGKIAAKSRGFRHFRIGKWLQNHDFLPFNPQKYLLWFSIAHSRFLIEKNIAGMGHVPGSPDVTPRKRCHDAGGLPGRSASWMFEIATSS